MKQIFGLLIATFAVVAPAYSQDAFLDKLKAVPGVTIIGRESAIQGYRVFNLTFKQPGDHKVAGQDEFEQRLVLWHKGEDRPMVLQTSGYNIFSTSLAALASEFNANQIQVEHRFFDPSTPPSHNWKLDNIEQSANDFHTITQAFKAIYTGAWVGTGRSKGGMTSVYHRRFFPNDLDATVAHVAPMSSSADDQRYADNVSHWIGGDENIECRARLLATQRLLLKNKATLIDQLGAATFNQLSTAEEDGKEVAVEHAIIELPWSFWQYSGPTPGCANIPDVTGTEGEDPSAAIAFLNENNAPSGYADGPLAGFVPYYFQAATQLGSPGATLSDLALKFPLSYNIFRYTPKEIGTAYDNGIAMADVGNWTQYKAERMLYIYGGWDPWSGGQFAERPAGDSFKYMVPGHNHSSQFIDLEGATRTFVYGKLRKWLKIEGEAANPFAPRERGPTLEDREFEYLKKNRRGRTL